MFQYTGDSTYFVDKLSSRIVVDIFILTMEGEGTWKGRKIVWKRYQEGGRGENLGQILVLAAQLQALQKKFITF